MVHFKSCPRCKGDVDVKNDWYGDYLVCMQCGWSRDVTEDPMSRLAEVFKAHQETLAVKKAS